MAPTGVLETVPMSKEDAVAEKATTAMSKSAMAAAVIRIRETPFDPEKDMQSSVVSPSSTIAPNTIDTPTSKDGGETTPSPTPPEVPVVVLGRYRQLAVIFFIIMASLTQYMSNFLTFAGGYWFTEKLVGSASPGGSIWMVSAFSLTQSSVVLVGGRLGAIYGHQLLILIGLGIITAMSIANGFCNHYVGFIVVRAITGLGGGLLMPNAVAMIAITVPPGRTRNITMGCFGAAAPVGGWLGGLMDGLIIKHDVHWSWLFYIMAIISAVVFVGLVFLLPREEVLDKDGKIDYIGALLGLGALALFNIVWTQAPTVGWQQPYEIVLLIVSLILFAAFIVWEQRFAKEPIMPLSIFTKAPTFSALIVTTLLTYMSFGISLWYLIAYQQLIRHYSVLHFIVSWLPFCFASVAAVGLAAFLIRHLAAQYIMALGIISVLLTNLLLATMPVHQTYWGQTFVATLLSGICPDLAYVAAQIIASNTVSRRKQGIAGSLIGTLNLYGNSLGLGPAATIESQVNKHSSSDVVGYRAALYFGVALGAVALAVDLIYVRMPRDRREGWDSADEEELRAAVQKAIPQANNASQTV